MAKNIKNLATVNTAQNSLQNDPCIARIPILDDESAEYYTRNEYRIVTIRLGTKKPSRYVLFPMQTPEEARNIERIYGACNKREDRHDKSIRKNECSLTGLLDAGYDPSPDALNIPLNIKRTLSPNDEEFDVTQFADHKANPTRSRGAYDASGDALNPETIMLKKYRDEAVHKALEELTPEQRNIVSIICTGQSERSLAADFGISQSTLHDRKVKAMKILAEKLTDIR